MLVRLALFALVELAEALSISLLAAWDCSSFPAHPVQVTLLFQCIDGVDLCLYCMYMQEYGEDVPPPNRKSGARPLLLAVNCLPFCRFSGSLPAPARNLHTSLPLLY